MLAAFLMGLVGGQRAMTPLAAVAFAAARGGRPEDNGAPRIIAHPFTVTVAMALAAAELAGDKMKTAPDRIVPVGLAARFIASAIAGAALAPARQRWPAATLGGSTAVVASYLGWRLRVAAMRRYGQTPTGLVEDVLVVTGAIAIVRTQGRSAA